jgi:hypothetical protein
MPSVLRYDFEIFIQKLVTLLNVMNKFFIVRACLIAGAPTSIDEFKSTFFDEC